MVRWPVKMTALALAAAFLFVAGCSGRDATNRSPGAGAGAMPGDSPQTARAKVVTTFYPLHYFARAVGGDRVEVVSLVPNGVEPHDWEPTATDIKTLNSARVFIYNGAGLEPWLDRILSSLENPALVVVDSSAGLDLLPAADHDDDGAHGEHDGDGAHDEHDEDFDPHIWLDPVYNQHQVDLIAKALSQADPAGQAAYEANAASLTRELQVLDQEYQALTACPRKDIVISHAFFGYPARRYGLEQVPIMGIAPDAEPTPRQMAALVQLIRERQIRYIFAETLVSSKVGQVIAAETGAEVLVLNPIEGLTQEQEAQGQDFLGLMRENLAHLKVALECTR